MKQQNETQNHTKNSKQNHSIEGQTEEPKTVLITKQQLSNFKKVFYQFDEEGYQNLLRFKHQLAKKIIKKQKT
ncbi:unnamed protein product [Paramecium pentaurelia]|uniref:Uncharacterized protein n=1 Tax=Paramecium pentaurelia TaxID=43138 RepID=A0A8S1V7S4_9CILI|nr:unnamed protein product [Paramecium pentaurelia]